MDDFDARWDAAWPGVLPIADRLRATTPERWVRIHAEGEGRDRADRGADAASGPDRGAIVRRHRALIEELFGAGDVVVVAEDWPEPDRAGGWAATALPDARPWRRVEPLGDDGPAELSVTTVPTGRLAALLDLVIDGRALFVAADSAVRRLYAPYDLGADVFFVDPAERDAFASRHEAWLSPRPDGL